MKNLLSRVAGFLLLLTLTSLVALFAYNMSQRPLQSSITGQSQSSGYPEPEIASNASIQNSYPAPASIALSETTAPNLCSEFGKWNVYSDKVAGYSLKYPAESDLRESSSADENYRSVSIYLKPSCHGQQCGGSNQVIISSMQNPDELLIAEFVEQEFKSLISSPHTSSPQDIQVNQADIMEVAGTQGLRVQSEKTFNQPNIFIPHGDRVIRVYINTASPVPPHDPPCNQTLDMLDNILNSIELLSLETN